MRKSLVIVGSYRERGGRDKGLVPGKLLKRPKRDVKVNRCDKERGQWVR